MCRRIGLGVGVGIKKGPSVEGSYRVVLNAVIRPVCMEEKQRTVGKMEFVYQLD